MVDSQNMTEKKRRGRGSKDKKSGKRTQFASSGFL